MLLVLWFARHGNAEQYFGLSGKGRWNHSHLQLGWLSSCWLVCKSWICAGWIEFQHYESQRGAIDEHSRWLQMLRFAVDMAIQGKVTPWYVPSRSGYTFCSKTIDSLWALVPLQPPSAGKLALVQMMSRKLGPSSQGLEISIGFFSNNVNQTYF